MNEIKSVKEVEKMINEILEKRQNTESSLNIKIEHAHSEKNSAEEEMKDAMLKENLKGYQVAKERSKNAEDAIEMYSEMLEAVKNKPLIDEKKYISAYQNIENDLQKIVNDEKKEIVKHIEALQALASESRNMINKANKVLHDLQYKVYRCNDIKTDSAGHMMALKDIEFNDWEVSDFVEQISTGEFYKQIKNEVSFIEKTEK